MITTELISYIRKQIKNNISDDIIISKLTKAGWHKEDIDEGISSVHLELKPEFYIFDSKKYITNNSDIKNTNKTLDQYREPVMDGDIIDFDVKKEENTVEKHNIVNPLVEIPKVDSAVFEIPKLETPIEEAVKIETPLVESFKTITPSADVSKIEITNIELPKIEKPKEEIFDIEIPDIKTPIADIPKTEDSKAEIPKVVETYDFEIPATDPSVAKLPESEIAKAVNTLTDNSKIIPETSPEEFPVDTYKQEIAAPEISKIESPIKEINKIWTPRRVPVIEKMQSEDTAPKEEKTLNQVIVQNPELSIGEKENTIIQNPATEIPKENIEQDVPKNIPEGDDIILNQAPRIPTNPFYSTNSVDLPKSETPTVPSETSKNFLFDNLPKTAMLSSYESDFSSANKELNGVVKKKNFKTILWLLLSILILSGIAWAFIGGFININNIPFIKKDPKVLLLNNSKVLASLKSYKTETNIEISSPSFANISSGLISGEAIPSTDKDSFSIKTLGSINQNNKGVFSSNYITVKSSLLSKEITTGVNNNNSDLFITISDLGQIIKESDGEPQTIKINEKDFSSVPSLFSADVEASLKKINLYKILSNGMSSYIDTKTMSVYDEFINNVKITEKGQEVIKGVDTYHYTINTERPLIKKLLNKIADDFTLNLSVEDKDKLNQILGSTTVESFDVWVGKGDNNIYQTSVVLNIPLSKILSFEDKSIGDNQVKFAWKTTYYDFNKINDISTPEISTPFADFVKSINETKIKNDVSTMKQLATSLHNAEGVYGKKPNMIGSCMSPVSGSLFSPIGHTKGSSTAVSSISELLNKVLKITNNYGFCYSTPSAWSFTIPISDNYDSASIPVGGYQSFFCIDNTGSTKNIIAPPKGVTCE
ncbi:MAG: hypothetical protein NTU81_01675 [Candidatus Nomurabacteria bacterium]|nr:hypothetical protein [Candidatus Nomurabacteria bacterium]